MERKQVHDRYIHSGFLVHFSIYQFVNGDIATLRHILLSTQRNKFYKLESKNLFRKLVRHHNLALTIGDKLF